MTEATKQPEESGVDSTVKNQTQETQVDAQELMSQLDAIKKAQQGSDRKVSELEKQLEKERKEKEELRTNSMSVEEKMAYLQEIKDAKEKEFETKLQALERENLKKDFMLNKGISPELSDYIRGGSIDELEENANKLLEGIKAEADRLVKEKLSGSTPKTGSSQETTKNLTAEEIALLPEADRIKAYKQAGYI